MGSNCFVFGGVFCLQEAEERLKKEFNETFKIQHQSHRLEIQTLEEKAKKELHDELKQIQKQQTLLLGMSHVMHSSYCLIICWEALTFLPFIFFPVFWELRALWIFFSVPCKFSYVDLIFFVNLVLNCQQQNIAGRVVWYTMFEYALSGILNWNMVVSVYDFPFFSLWYEELLYVAQVYSFEFSSGHHTYWKVSLESFLNCSELKRTLP